MTGKEWKVLVEMLDHIKDVAVDGPSYDFDSVTGKMTRTASGETRESIERKLAKGSDYRAGWEACRARVLHYFRELELQRRAP